MNHKSHWFFQALLCGSIVIGLIFLATSVSLFFKGHIVYRLENVGERSVEAIHANPEGVVIQYGAENYRRFKVISWSRIYSDTQTTVARLTSVWPEEDSLQYSLVLPSTSPYIRADTHSFEKVKEEKAAKEKEENSPAAQRNNRSNAILLLMATVLMALISTALIRSGVKL